MKKIYFLLIVLIESCNQSALPPKSYVAFVRDPAHKLHQSIRSGPVEFEVQYQPLQYVCLLENGASTISTSTLSELESQFSGLSYFIFSISGTEQSDPILSVTKDSALLKQRINYLSFEANKDFWLVQNGDTLHCVMHHFERNYGVSPREDIVLAFDPIKNDTPHGEIIFCYRDGLLGTGYHVFSFKISDINSIPSLKTI